MHRRYLPLIAFLFLIAACKKQVDKVADPFDPAVYKELKDAAYGTDAAQKFDLYLPANRSNATKAIVLLHGGAWAGGDKTDMNAFIAMFKARYPEVAIINMNYRLASGTTNNHPAQTNDIKAMLDLMDKQKDVWHMSNNYAMGGVSAGAHLSLLYAYKFDVPKRIKAVVSVVGPTNFLDPVYVNDPTLRLVALNYIGKPYSDSASYRDASPVHVITATAPPTFMSYGGADPLVPVSNATALRQKLISLSIPYQYNFYPAEGHEFSAAVMDETVNRIISFLKTYQ